MPDRLEALSDDALQLVQNFDEVDLADMLAGATATNVDLRQQLADATAQAYRDAADLILSQHGGAPDVYSPQDSAALLVHVSNGGDPKDTVYPR